MLNQHFGDELGTASIRNNPSGRSTEKGFSIAHEYAIFLANSENSSIGRLERNEAQIARYDEKDTEGQFEWVNFRKHGGTRAEAPTMFYPIFISEKSFKVPHIEWDETKMLWKLLEKPKTNEEIIYPIDESGQERRWKWGVDRVKNNPTEFKVDKDRSGKNAVYCKARLNDEGILPLTWWEKKEYSATAYGTNLLKDIFRTLQSFSYPKSVYAVMDCLKVAGLEPNCIAIDYFAGSGTTAHAVLNLNREDNGKRKYILVEMGEYFDAVLKPRIQKVVYSKDWKDGKPVSREGIRACRQID